MTSVRRYRLLCPVARSLDVLGDRWSLLILRDLHAGPARFGELEAGLGVATNLLAARLDELQRAGLVERSDAGPRSPYRLTEAGRRTDRIIWELVRFGSTVDPDPEPRPAGNLRTLVLPLRVLLESVTDRPAFTARLVVDDECFVVRSTPDDVDVVYGDRKSSVEVEVETSYEPFLALAEGRLDQERFAREHRRVVVGDERAPAVFATLLAGLEALR